VLESRARYYSRPESNVESAAEDRFASLGNRIEATPPWLPQRRASLVRGLRLRSSKLFVRVMIVKALCGSE